MGSRALERRPAKKSYLQGHRVCPLEAGVGVEVVKGVPSSLKPGQSWADLPQPLLETVFGHLQDNQAAGPDPWAGFMVSSVCRSWRAAASSVFFSKHWEAGDAIQHPAQLFQLCPPRFATGATIKCYLKREVVSGGLSGRLHRFILCQGSDYSSDNGKFLMAALQLSKQRYALYLQRNLTGPPAARLASNLMRTGYTLVPSSSGWVRAMMAGPSQHQPHCMHSSSSSRPVAHEEAHLGPLKLLHGGPSEASFHKGSRPWGAGRGHLKGAGGEEAGPPGPLAHVAYKLRVRGMMLPRRMSVSLPLSPLSQRPDQRLRDPGCCPHQGLPDCQTAASSSGGWEAAGQAQQQQPGFMGLAQASWLPASPRSSSRYSSSSSSSSGRLRHSSRRRSWRQLDEHPADDAEGAGSTMAGPGSWSRAARVEDQGASAGGCCAGEAGALKLRNKPPHWNEGLRCWCLNFRGRVKLASVKNFQLVAVGDKEASHRGRPGASSSSSSCIAGGRMRGSSGGSAGSGMGGGSPWGIAMQFGKVDTDLFILDYDPCLVSCCQAFAVALTTFETKILL